MLSRSNPVFSNGGVTMVELLPAKILYVDNDVETCEWIKASFFKDEREFDVTCISGTAEALDLIQRSSFDVFVLEYSLLEMTGAELCRKIRLTDRNTPVVIYSALYREIDRERAVWAGANAFVIKSDGLSNLSATIRRLLDRRPVITRNYHSGRRSSSIL